MRMMSNGIGESVPSACQDWANTKAAYRFFSNKNVSEEHIMDGHFQATRGRLSQTKRTILMLHDTCEFSFQRDQDSITEPEPLIALRQLDEHTELHQGTAPKTIGADKNYHQQAFVCAVVVNASCHRMWPARSECRFLDSISAPRRSPATRPANEFANGWKRSSVGSRSSAA